jgi:hypothetical protein
VFVKVGAAAPSEESGSGCGSDSHGSKRRPPHFLGWLGGESAGDDDDGDQQCEESHAEPNDDDDQDELDFATLERPAEEEVTALLAMVKEKMVRSYTGGRMAQWRAKQNAKLTAAAAAGSKKITEYFGAPVDVVESDSDGADTDVCGVN